MLFLRLPLHHARARQYALWVVPSAGQKWSLHHFFALSGGNLR